MRLLYSVVLYCLVPLIVIRLFWLSLANPAYRRRISERFGFVNYSSGNNEPVLWVHAVSVGEVQSTRPLINAIKSTWPQFRIVITTTTPTGADTARQIYGDRVQHFYVPYDLPGAVQRFCRRVQPLLLLVMETELWPNLYHRCHARGVPVIIANARLSGSSLAGYKKLESLSGQTVRLADRILAQSEIDAERFLQLGAQPEQVRVTGNLKFDALVPARESGNPADNQKPAQFPGRRVWLAASTHAGEELLILQQHAKIQEEFPTSLLIIAPRHPPRFAEVVKMAKSAGFTVQRMSAGAAVSDKVQVFVLDTLGDLPDYYATADVAFVGGSLVPVGGHNPLEPAALGVPVLFGPHTFNFTAICQELLECEAATLVKDAANLAATVVALFRDPERRRAAGEAGREYVHTNRGTTDVMMAELMPFLDVSPG